MIFNINPYYGAFVADCIEHGIWHGTTWEECFRGLGFSSYKFDGYDDSQMSWHYLNDDEFVIFALRFS